MTNGPWPRVPEHLIQSIQEDCHETWGYYPEREIARIWAVQRDHRRRSADRAAGRSSEPSEIEYADPGQDSYANFDRIWAADSDSDRH